MSCYRGSRGHCRAHQVGTPPRTLPAFKVTIGSGSAAFAGFQPVVIHCKAHRATRFAPFKSCIAEYPVKPLLLRLMLDQARTWHDHRKLDALGNTTALYHLRCGP